MTLTPTDVRRSLQERDRLLIRTIERIRVELGLNNRDWSEYLHITENEYEKTLKSRKPLSALSLYHLSERLSLDPVALEAGKIDYAALVQAHFGNRSYLNPDYKVAASSRKFTVVNTLDFVEKHRGRHLRVAANRNFQVHEDFWSDWQDPNSDRINIRYVSELWKFLRTRGLTDEDFRSIGFHSIFTHRHTHIGRRLSSFEHPKQVYECLINNLMDQFERNHRYRIDKLTDGVCVIESRTNSDVADELGVSHTGSIEGCQVKIGMLRSMPAFVGRSSATIHETHCVHRGDTTCRFVCDFSESQFAANAHRRLTLLS